MHDDRTLVERRLDRMLRERLRPAIHLQSEPLAVAIWDAPGEPASPATALSAPYTKAAVGDRWGQPWSTRWFQFTGRVPSHWVGQTIEAVIDLGFDDEHPGFAAEGLAYRPDGTPIKGVHPRSRWVRVAAPASGGENVAFYIEAAANPAIVGPITSLGDPATAGDEPLYQLRKAELAIFDHTTWELVHDLEVLGQLMNELSTGDPRRWEILRTIDHALDAINLGDVAGTAAAAREVVAPALAAPARASAHRISAIGHAHIDSAWLWPIRETIRKVTRTCANVVDLMDSDPELVFAMSQAQQLAWLAQDRPEVFARVKEKIATGQFVPVGGMWVEADTNLPGSEALARQLVYGKRYYLEQFGIETKEVWLPDSFGYSAAFPQLVKLSGSRWFLTQKLSWNETNTFPHHTFWWEGIDGSRVFTHFPPVDTYNAELSGRELAHAVSSFRDKGTATRSLVPFGYGDGGGGPTREMLARSARLRDLDGSPKVAIESPADFFTDAEAEYGERAPVWVGELYLERHRGTYTSQATTKQGNRKAEHLLREAELWAATAAVRTGHVYPYEQIDRIWKTVLTNQFHDILPGSSIAWVHREAAASYAKAIAELEEIIASAQHALAGSGDHAIVFNSAPHEHSGVPAGGAAPDLGTPSAAPVELNQHPDGTLTLDNRLLRVTIDENGSLTSIIHHASGRDALVPQQPANVLHLHPDVPNDWDAWDLDAHYRNSGTEVSAADQVVVTESSKSSAAVRVVRNSGPSTFTQDIRLNAGDGTVVFDTGVDWHHTETILKVAFPLDLRAEHSVAETQYGHLRRPTHTNTSWDAAKFEICAHRYLYLDEPGWGVAIVNNSVYGHDVTRAIRDDGSTTTTARLSLLRAPRFPDPQTDQGMHRFSYALMPGSTVLDAVRMGYRFNLPPRRVTGGEPVHALVTADNDAVIIEAVKLADDQSGDVVVRVYEAVGARATVRLSTHFAISAVHETDLLERPTGRIMADDGEVELVMRPFQIRTLRFTRPSA